MVRRARSRQHEQFAARFGEVSPPRRVGIFGLGEQGSTWAAIALRGGSEVAVWEPDTLQRHEGRHHLDRSIQQAVAAGWLNAIEADQKREVTRVSKHHDGLDSVELILLTGPAETQQRELACLEALSDVSAIIVTVNHKPETGDLPQARRVVGLKFAGDSDEVELLPTPATDDATMAKLFRWLMRCGLRPRLPEPALPEAAAFAA